MIPEYIFNELCDILYKNSGIIIKKGKQTLVINRLHNRLKFLEMDNYKDYLKYLKSYSTNNELSIFIDCLSTNMTSLFRENHHFVHMNNVLKNNKSNKIKCWSSACSSGEEPYSIAMSAESILNENFNKFKILATDINRTVLEKANEGVYYNKDLCKIDSSLKLKYFKKKDDDSFKINDIIRKSILFKNLNLNDKIPLGVNQFDFIFCRNVMIYFNKDLRQKLINDISMFIKTDGYLYLGHADSIGDLEHNFKSIGETIYKLK